MPSFIEILSSRFDDPRLEILPSSAETLSAELERRGIGQVDSIVCGLPFNSLPPQVTREVLEAVRERLAGGGVMACIQQTPFQFKLLRSIFPRVQIARYVLRNVPPTFVLACDHGRQAAASAR